MDAGLHFENRWRGARTGRPTGRAGFVDLPLLAMLGSIVVAALLVWALLALNPARAGKPRLVLHCAAVFQPAMDLIVEDYEREYRVRIDPQYAGSGTLLGGIQASERGDLFLPADPSYLESARSLNLLRLSTPIAGLRPVLAVAAGNPLGLDSLDDLRRVDIRVGLADPDGASIGQISREALRAAGIWDEVELGVRVIKPTVSGIAMDLVAGAIDVTILWDQTAASNASIDGIQIAELEGYESVAEIGLLRESQNMKEAARFAAYLTGRGQKRLLEAGFHAPDGSTP